MRTRRFSLLLLLAVLFLAPLACTNPMGPKPSGDDVAQNKL